METGTTRATKDVPKYDRGDISSAEHRAQDRGKEKSSCLKKAWSVSLLEHPKQTPAKQQ